MRVWGTYVSKEWKIEPRRYQMLVAVISSSVDNAAGSTARMICHRNTKTAE